MATTAPPNSGPSSYLFPLLVPNFQTSKPTYKHLLTSKKPQIRLLRPSLRQPFQFQQHILHSHNNNQHAPLPNPKRHHIQLQQISKRHQRRLLQPLRNRQRNHNRTALRMELCPRTQRRELRNTIPSWRRLLRGRLIIKCYNGKYFSCNANHDLENILPIPHTKRYNLLLY